MEKWLKARPEKASEKLKSMEAVRFAQTLQPRIHKEIAQRATQLQADLQNEINNLMHEQNVFDSDDARALAGRVRTLLKSALKEALAEVEELDRRWDFDRR